MTSIMRAGPRTGSASPRARASRGSCSRTCSLPCAPSASAPTGSASRSMVRCRALLDRVDQVAVEAVADLELDPAGAPTDHGPSLPEPLAHGEAEALPQRLLEHHVGDPLERVDLHRTDLVQVRQQVDVAVTGACGLGVVPAPGTLPGRRSPSSPRARAARRAPARARGGTPRSRRPGPSTGRSG